MNNKLITFKLVFTFGCTQIFHYIYYCFYFSQCESLKFNILVIPINMLIQSKIYKSNEIRNCMIVKIKLLKILIVNFRHPITQDHRFMRRSCLIAFLSVRRKIVKCPCSRTSVVNGYIMVFFSLQTGQGIRTQRGEGFTVIITQQKTVVGES